MVSVNSISQRMCTLWSFIHREYARFVNADCQTKHKCYRNSIRSGGSSSGSIISQCTLDCHRASTAYTFSFDIESVCVRCVICSTSTSMRIDVTSKTLHSLPSHARCWFRKFSLSKLCDVYPLWIMCLWICRRLFMFLYLCAEWVMGRCFFLSLSRSMVLFSTPFRMLVFFGSDGYSCTWHHSFLKLVEMSRFVCLLISKASFYNTTLDELDLIWEQPTQLQQHQRNCHIGKMNGMNDTREKRIFHWVSC